MIVEWVAYVFVAFAPDGELSSTMSFQGRNNYTRAKCEEVVARYVELWQPDPRVALLHGSCRPELRR